ncbi:MAG: hypothetical protein GF364_10050 [Candidatus Lokiarchaeota archaeon]|nr:hypothetical protein [Candidatus Lokiarchaeota archaeon]
MENDQRELIENIKQRLLNNNHPLSSILLSAKALAYIQKNKRMIDWLKMEIDGYDDNVPVPDYRKIVTRPEGDFVIDGVLLRKKVLPFNFLPEDFTDRFFNVRIFDSISAIEENIISSDTSFHSRWPQEIIQVYNNYAEGYLEHVLVDAFSGFRKSHLRAILTSVRSRLQDYLFEIDDLDWSKDLKLEEKTEILENIFTKNVYNIDSRQFNTTFDQSGQHVKTQYNAGGDINFNENMTPTEFLGSLNQIINQIETYQQHAKDSLHKEDLSKAKEELLTVMDESQKQNPDKTKIKTHLEFAHKHLPTIADIAQIAGFIISAKMNLPLIFSK